MSLLALVQDAAADEGGRQLMGYVIIVAGVMDLLAAGFIVGVANMPAEKKQQLGLVLGLAGFGMIAIGILIALGVIL